MACKMYFFVFCNIPSMKFTRWILIKKKYKKDIPTGIHHKFIQTFQRFTKHLEVFA